MPPRFRSSILFAFFLVVLYLVIPFGSDDESYETGTPVGIPNGVGTGAGNSAVKDKDKGEAVKGGAPPNSVHSSSALPTASAAAKVEAVTQEQFNKEHDALELKETSGSIYGTTLNTLLAAGNHAGFAAAALKPTENWTPYNDQPPLTYNPYPEYNNKAWNASNQGAYVPCEGPHGKVLEVVVFSGHPEAFGEGALGSYVPLEIDSNLCFERESRLRAYGYQEEGSENTEEGRKEGTDWNSVTWGKLQEYCYEKNGARYSKMEDFPKIESGTLGVNATWANSTSKDSGETIIDPAEARRQGLHGLPEQAVQPKSRTAVLLRSYSGKNYTENDKQNIRSLVTELSLRSGGEYQVYLLIHIDGDVRKADPATHKKVLEDSVPPEFWDMTVFWDDATMKEWYPLIPEAVNNVNQSKWLSVQKFAEENPQFDYYWNWELDSRYTGHHYNLLEKLVSFADSQPRKYLWERNERYYIPTEHGHYNSQFRSLVEKTSAGTTIWGAPFVSGVTPIGPRPPVADPNRGTYDWGVGEEADFISLAPIFNPVGTEWAARNDVWGYDKEKAPRRASIGTQSRCSKLLLNTMHKENQKGNHVSSEMGPPTVALLHSLKAVYAPVPVYFDRAWTGQQLDRWFNPGPNGVSGSTEESPFSAGRESRFEGSTWYSRALPPMRLYNNWMGWEDSGIGGAEWEKRHGRSCLPPMLLHPIKDVTKPPPGHFSKLESL